MYPLSKPPRPTEGFSDVSLNSQTEDKTRTTGLALGDKVDTHVHTT